MKLVSRRSVLAAVAGASALAVSGCGQSRSECERETRQRWRSLYQRDPTPTELGQQCRRRSSRAGGVGSGK